MSTLLRSQRLATIALVGVAGLLPTGLSFLAPAPSLARSLTSCEISAQDPYGQEPDPGPLLPSYDDDGMPLPGNKRRGKAVRKKGTASDKSKKSDSTGKGQDCFESEARWR